jgi:hypothetical protein
MVIHINRLCISFSQFVFKIYVILALPFHLLSLMLTEEWPVKWKVKNYLNVYVQINKQTAIPPKN